MAQRQDRDNPPQPESEVRKRHRIVLAARAWLAAQRGLGEAPCRFDVVGVGGPADALQVEWMRGAFSLEDV